MGRFRSASTRAGKEAELRFDAELLRRGKTIAKPGTEDNPIDTYIDLHRRGLMCRCQVKKAKLSTAKKGEKARYWEIKLESTTSGKYTKDEVDFIVGWIPNTNRWYMIPIEDAEGRGKTVNLESASGTPNRRLAGYLDNWDSLDLLDTPE